MNLLSVRDLSTRTSIAVFDGRKLVVSMNRLSRESLEQFAPRSHRAAQKLVVAAADLKKKRGKTGLFGANKGVRAEMKFHDSLREMVYAVREDGRQGAFDGEDLYKNLCAMLGVFSEAYPNWPDAYEELHAQLLKDEDAGRALVERCS